MRWNGLRSLAYRLACKAWELVLKAGTRLRRPFDGDPTRLLLDHFTPAQQAAEQELARARAGLPEYPRPSRVLVIIPFRDRWALTSRCLDSLLSQRAPELTVRIVLLDNGSREQATAEGLAEVLRTSPMTGREVRVLRLDIAFNFSRLNNQAVAANQDFGADYLLFLNNDIEFKSAHDLGSLIAFAQVAPRLGALGCTLEYPDGRLQHLFLAPGVKILAAHPLKGRRLEASWRWHQRPRPVGAVTGAVMIVGQDAFQRAGGFDEGLPAVGQDLDLCLKLQAQGLVNWTHPAVKAIHHEGASRGHAIDRVQVRRIYDRWGQTLLANPFYSTRLSRWSEQPTYSLGEGLYPWDKVLP